MAVLTCRNVSYCYPGTRNGIFAINLTVEPGEMVAVVGRNGAGKSTLLNLISGYLKPDDGSIRCADTLTYHDFGVSAQRQTIDWYLNVEDNILIGAELVGIGKRAARESADRIMAILDLTALKRRASDSLSGGQLQRAQVARALVHRPKIAILDEPTAGLDFHYSKRMFAYLSEQCGETGCSVLVSSHDLNMLETYCGKILVVDQGKQVFFGEMSEFLKTALNRRTITVAYDGSFDESGLNVLRRLGAELEDSTIRVSDDRANEFFSVLPELLKSIQIKDIRMNQLNLAQRLSREENNEA